MIGAIVLTATDPSGTGADAAGLRRALDAVSGCDPIAVAGTPGIDAAELRAAAAAWVAADPAAPVAAIGAALSTWTADPEWTLVVDAALPTAGEAVAALRRDLPLFPADTEGVCLADASSRPRWLPGLYRTAALRRSVSALGEGARGAALADLVDDLAIAAVAAPAAVAAAWAARS